MWPKPSWSHSVWGSDAGGGTDAEGGERSSPRPFDPGSGSGRGGQLARSEDAATLTLAATAPHAVVDAVSQGVLEAPLLRGTSFADALGDFDANAV